MSKRAESVHLPIKGSPRSELVVSQQNTTASNTKRSRISKKAESVSSLSGKNDMTRLQITNQYIIIEYCKLSNGLRYINLLYLLFIGINKKWNEQYHDTVKKNQTENVSGSSNDSKLNMTNTNGDNRENDHDYGVLPGRNGHYSNGGQPGSPNGSSGN